MKTNQKVLISNIPKIIYSYKAFSIVMNNPFIPSIYMFMCDLVYTRSSRTSKVESNKYRRHLLDNN